MNSLTAPSDHDIDFNVSKNLEKTYFIEEIWGTFLLYER